MGHHRFFDGFGLSGVRAGVNIYNREEIVGGPVQFLLWFGVLYFVNRRNRRFCGKVRGVNLGW
jgi:hypothetical protein